MLLSLLRAISGPIPSPGARIKSAAALVQTDPSYSAGASHIHRETSAPRASNPTSIALLIPYHLAAQASRWEIEPFDILLAIYSANCSGHCPYIPQIRPNFVR